MLPTSLRAFLIRDQKVRVVALICLPQDLKPGGPRCESVSATHMPCILQQVTHPLNSFPKLQRGERELQTGLGHGRMCEQYWSPAFPDCCLLWFLKVLEGPLPPRQNGSLGVGKASQSPGPPDRVEAGLLCPR